MPPILVSSTMNVTVEKYQVPGTLPGTWYLVRFDFRNYVANMNRFFSESFSTKFVRKFAMQVG